MIEGVVESQGYDSQYLHGDHTEDGRKGTRFRLGYCLYYINQGN
jgi:hypothetical protein